MYHKSNLMEKTPDRYKYLKPPFLPSFDSGDVLLMVVRLAFDDGKRPVQLLGKEQTHHLMGERHA